MTEASMTFFDVIKNGTYGFEQISAYLVGLWNSIFASEHISAMLGWVNTALATVLPYLPYALLAIYALVLLFGQRLLGVIRFVVFLLAGFLLGTYYLATPVATLIPGIPAWAVGLTVGLLLAALGKVLYFVLYAVVAGYGTYLVCITGTVLTEIAGNYVVALIVAAIAVVLVFVLRGFIERYGTAFLGAYGILFVVRGWYDFTAFIPGFEWAVLLGSSAVLAILGCVVQGHVKKKKY